MNTRNYPDLNKDLIPIVLAEDDTQGQTSITNALGTLDAPLSANAATDPTVAVLQEAAKSADTEVPPSTHADNEGTAAVDGEIGNGADIQGVVEQFVLNEETAVVNGQPMQVVTLMDSSGRMLDQKHGKTGEQVVLEMHGQMFSYELQGPSADGEAITSTLLVSSSDPDEEETADIRPLTATVEQPPTTNTTWSQEITTNGKPEEDVDATASSQQFTLTEASAIVDGEPLQTVVLTDEQGNVLDQKQGRTGEHVLIEMSGNALEYVFLGPTEDGGPITTTLLVTSDPNVVGSESADDAGALGPYDANEAISTVADCCPAGLPLEFYSVLCRQVENIVATRIPRNQDGSSLYRPEPYHRKLGSLSTYQQMTELVNGYRVGASRGETLELYESLRNFARIYRPSGPQSRALTKYEVAMNEAAAQFSRYHPGLLFHKRELFHLAKETVEQLQALLISERKPQQSQETISQFPSQIQTELSVSKPQPQPPVQPTSRSIPPPTAAVSGRVANSQLALLESRGFSGIKQLALGSTSTGQTSFVVTSPVDLVSDSSAAVDRSSNTTTSFTSSDIANSNDTRYYPGVHVMKRDSFNKLSSAQEEALRTAAVELIVDLPRYDLKPKADCTNIELGCWEQAKQLASQALDTSSETHSKINSLICNEKRVEAVREAAALYGRTPGNSQFPGPPSGVSRSSPVSALIPYEIACNEAASYLAAAVPQLLTHRRELSELAKKIVRNSGCLFTNTVSTDKMIVGSGGYRFFCSDQLPELDLSAADQLLTDPLDRSDSPDSGCCLAMSEPEMENVVLNFPTLSLTCEECNNVIDDVTIYTATGTDSLKKVRILNLSDCGFTGLVPMHLNQCTSLIELNLSGNALYAFPRCLHLPKLRRLNLRNNPRLLRQSTARSVLEPPLVEQFPRLQSLELDPQLAKLLSHQALACLCPYLKFINGIEFNEEPTEETIKTFQEAKNQLSSLIYSKWEDDIACFYKKGLPKRDAVRVVETLVLHSVKRSVDIPEPFCHCKSILARRVAEDFLSPKLLDDDFDEDAIDRGRSGGEASDEEDDAPESESDVDLDEEDDYSKQQTDPCRNSISAHTGDKDLPFESEVVDKHKLLSKRKTVKSVSAESTQMSVAEREAEAAAANLSLLPDEPPDRLINVVGQALRHGKTVVYAVIRTAARQPDGELIPVGGGLGVTSSGGAGGGGPRPVVQSSDQAAKQSNASVLLQTSYEGEAATSVNKAPVTGQKSASRPIPPSQRQHTPGPRRSGYQPKASATPSLAPSAPSATASFYTRRSGLLSREVVTPDKLLSDQITRTPAVSTVSVDSTPSGPVYTLKQRPLLPSDYIIRPSQSESQPALVVPNLLNQQKKERSSWTPGRRGRPPLAQSLAKRAAVAQAEAVATSKLIEHVTIPPPHSPPPPTMRMSTRDSNRLKRFSVYGVIDTAAALAGKEEALLAAALAVEDEQESTSIKQLMQPTTVPPTPPAPVLSTPAATSVSPTRPPLPSTSTPLPASPTRIAPSPSPPSPSASPTLSAPPPPSTPPAASPPPPASPIVTPPPSTPALTTPPPSSPSSSSSHDDELTAEEIALAKAKEDAMIVVLEPGDTQWATKMESPVKEPEVIESGRKRKRRPTDQNAVPSPTPAPESTSTTESPVALTRKRPPRAHSPKPPEPKKAQTVASVPASTRTTPSRPRADSAKNISSLTQLGSIVDYDPLHFIRCHARDNDPLDCETKVWRCAFEPSVDDPRSETSSVVATCGGECVCLIDCRSGRVMKRFKHLGEEFYSLAWTTVEMAAGHKTNLLAAAGKLREIRLLHPEQLVCYAEMRGHKDDIACMIFHPEKPTILFSGDSKASVLVWDVGIPSAPEYRTRHQLLMRLVCPRPNLNPVLNLIFLPKYNCLLSGCEDGVFSWTFSEFRKEKLTDERQPDVELKIPTRREPCFDGLAKLSDDLVVVKCVEEGEIYVFDYSQVSQRSRRLGTKKTVNVEIRGQLRWHTTDEIYINVTARSGLNTVICGDNEGTIWLYDLQKQVGEDARRFKLKPLKILEWPECSIGGSKDEDAQMKENITSGFKNPVVNATDISHDGQYLAAVTDNNLVCIWKFSG
ncbi:unnamed protein product [Dicrocoelium dendriticum]|nr:unnamed protein product [Dicrocoelium dendriticum]